MLRCQVVCIKLVIFFFETCRVTACWVAFWGDYFWATLRPQDETLCGCSPKHTRNTSIPQTATFNRERSRLRRRKSIEHMSLDEVVGQHCCTENTMFLQWCRNWCDVLFFFAASLLDRDLSVSDVGAQCQKLNNVRFSALVHHLFYWDPDTSQRWTTTKETNMG